MALPVPLVFPAFLTPADAAGMMPAHVRALLTPQEWRAVWEKWVLSAAAPRGAADEPPPMYTPREGEAGASAADGKAAASVAESAAASAPAPAASVVEVAEDEAEDEDAATERPAEAEPSARGARRAVAKYARAADAAGTATTTATTTRRGNDDGRREQAAATTSQRRRAQAH